VADADLWINREGSVVGGHIGRSLQFHLLDHDTGMPSFSVTFDIVVRIANLRFESKIGECGGKANQELSD